MEKIRLTRGNDVKLADNSAVIEALQAEGWKLDKPKATKKVKAKAKKNDNRS